MVSWRKEGFRSGILFLWLQTTNTVLFVRLADARTRCAIYFLVRWTSSRTPRRPIVSYNEPAHPAMNELAAFFKEQGLFTYMRWSSFSCIPPLTISEAELNEGFEIIDRDWIHGQSV